MHRRMARVEEEERGIEMVENEVLQGEGIVQTDENQLFHDKGIQTVEDRSLRRWGIVQTDENRLFHDKGIQTVEDRSLQEWGIVQTDENQVLQGEGESSDTTLVPVNTKEDIEEEAEPPKRYTPDNPPSSMGQ